jgi:hypothetical protein
MQNASVSNNKTGARVGPRAPPALDPERVALVQPYKDFVAKAWIIDFSLKITPSTTSMVVTLSPDIKTDKPVKDIAAGVAKQIIIEAGLWTPGQRGVQKSSGNSGEQLPKRSLCKRDFDGTSDNALKARISSVAKEIGDDRARGRIGSLRLMVEGVDKFAAWWKQALPNDKMRLLADKKAIDQLDPQDILRFSRLTEECPFRGTVPTPSEEEEDQEPIKKGGGKAPAKRN